MTAPLTPHDEPAPGPESAGDETPYAAHTPEPAPEDQAAAEDERGMRAEVLEAALVGLAVAVTGVLLGLLWLWLAPRVPLYTDGQNIYLMNAEGEERVGADGTFVLLGLGMGLVTAGAVFWFRRRGGIPLVVGLAVGSLIGSYLAWKVGLWLDPNADMVESAKEAGKGATFDGPLQLQAKGALLAWPVAAMGVHLALTGLFGPRDPEPDPDWSHQPQG
ncbi:hypothetical protein LRS74_25665 [Streptomyces sp. LX-29]|uniref:hypothetical protein n=1 Tax=Streptomyces sp. LX-29 TaxID=2900152 RepID=UPI00240E4FE5|nr:hypothetical protein [Streptomyces sp. LX-29]WFB10049.1 hypothetical protein LRS74_25665 [Streptomyces sp. LX-29]